MYKLTPLDRDGKQAMVKRLYDETYIPFDNSNADYQAYLKWVAEGNTPEPADS